MTRLLRTVLLLAAYSGFTRSPAQQVPDLKFQDLAGHAHHLKGLRGSITVVSFWATWCTPCRAELPRLSQLQKQYAGSGVRFVAISVDEPKDRAKIGPFLQKQNITLEAWLGADVGTLNRLGLGDVVPATVVLDSDGNAIGRISGEARNSDVTQYLDWLLHGHQDFAPGGFVKRF